MFANNPKGMANKTSSGGFVPRPPSLVSAMSFPYYFPNTFHLYIYSYTHGIIYEDIAYFKYAQWTTLQSEVGQAIKKSWRLHIMLGHSISKIALPWHSKIILNKMSSMGSAWNAPWLLTICIFLQLDHSLISLP